MVSKRSDLEHLDPIRRYLDEASRYALLTKHDETRLAQVIEDGVAARGIASAAPPEDAAITALLPAEVARIRQIEARAIAKLRHPAYVEELHALLGS